MRACNPSAMPLLTECIIVATFSGRILAHRYQSQIDIYFKSTQDFWERHQWIDSMLQQRMESFAVKYPPAAQQADPILLFISMMWHANVLGMHQAIQRVVPLADERSAVMMEQTKRAHNAARDIVALGKNLAHLNLLKACCVF